MRPDTADASRLRKTIPTSQAAIHFISLSLFFEHKLDSCPHVRRQIWGHQSPDCGHLLRAIEKCGNEVQLYKKTAMENLVSAVRLVLPADSSSLFPRAFSQRDSQNLIAFLAYCIIVAFTVNNKACYTYCYDTVDAFIQFTNEQLKNVASWCW